MPLNRSGTKLRCSRKNLRAFIGNSLRRKASLVSHRLCRVRVDDEYFHENASPSDRLASAHDGDGRQGDQNDGE